MEAIHKPVGELLDAVPRQPKIKRSAYQESGRYPIIDQSQADIAGYTDDESWLYQGELPVVIFGDHTRVLKFVDFPFCVGADGTQLLRPVALLLQILEVALVAVVSQVKHSEVRNRSNNGCRCRLPRLLSGQVQLDSAHEELICARA